MREKVFVSVIVPTYNNKDTLGKAVASLNRQSYPRDCYEIIIVDDGSTDGTRRYVEQEGCFRGVRYIYQKNKGPAAARNLGVQNALGEIVAFIDSDCVVAPIWIEEISKGYETPRLAGTGGTVKAVPTSSAVSQYCAYVKLNETPLMDKTGVMFVITNNASFRKSYYKAAGGFDERYDFPGGEEPDLCYRLRKKGYFFQYNRDAFVYSNHKESLGRLLRSYFNYGKGDSFLTLSKLTEWDLASVSGLKWYFNFIKMVLKAGFVFINDFRFIIRFMKIPFKTLLYYGEGLGLRQALIFAWFDYVKQLWFIAGIFWGYILGRFRGLRKQETGSILKYI
ncbi:MAG: glycosyltransferase [Candidatus Omnitrophica bacterium]|nr:glycosyltransferase [Candidatus Omnitrophota bacterium]